MTLMNSVFKNQRGAVVLSTLIIISVMIVIMVGIASIQVMQIAKDSSRANEALKYLDIMEEMGQTVARARQLGRAFDFQGGACPTGTGPAIPVATGISICAPGGTIAGTCLSRTDKFAAGQSVCLESVTVVTSTDASANTPTLDIPQMLAKPATASTEPLTSSATLNANYHSEEPWFPKADATAWPASNKNEIRTPTCEHDSQTWLGCVRCNTLGVTCLEFKVCPPGVAAGCTRPYVQRIAVW